MPEEMLDDGNALGMLRNEHEKIRTLLANVWESDQPEFTKQAIIPLLQELEIHSMMEREFFCPFAMDYANQLQVERVDKECDAIDDLGARLQNLDTAGDDFRSTLESLIHEFQRHILHTDEFVLRSLEGRDWDMHNLLVALAIKMRERRAEMIERMNRTHAIDGTATPRATDIQHRRAQEMGRNIYPGRDVVPDVESDTTDLSMTTEGDIVNMGDKSMELGNEDARGI